VFTAKHKAGLPIRENQQRDDGDGESQRKASKWLNGRKKRGGVGKLVWTMTQMVRKTILVTQVPLVKVRTKTR